MLSAPAVLYTLNFVPLFSMSVSAYIRSFDYSQQLLTPYFEHKNMTPEQVNLFLTERHMPLRLFAFTCACLERVPLVGIFFSISSHVATALLAEDIEKRQHLVATGQIAKVDSLPSLTWSNSQHLKAHAVRATSLSGTPWRLVRPPQPPMEILPASPPPAHEACVVSSALAKPAPGSASAEPQIVHRAAPQTNSSSA